MNCAVRLASVTALSISALAQVGPPKHESNEAHVKQSRAQNYSERFDEVKCAIVQIFQGSATVGTPYGTGFYVSSAGDIVTASHVVGQRIWTHKDGGVTVDLETPESLTVVNNSGEAYVFSKSDIEEDRDAWAADLVRISTKRKTKCWLAIGDDSKVRPGDLVITMGFPGLAFGSLSLYEGIVSATHVKNNVPIGRTTDGNLVTPENEFTRVQLPSSGGLSGAPILNDQNRAIAVLDLAGVWAAELDALIQRGNTGQLGPPVLQPPMVPQPNTLNLGWALAALANSVHNFASPGYGDSVPLSYLKKKTEPKNPTSLKSGH
jgi:hypothetical protein